MGVKIDSIAYYLPPQKLTNEDLVKGFPEFSAPDILKKTGIKTRHLTTLSVTASDLAIEAANLFFEQNNAKKEEVEFLIFCTECPDFIAPATACILQNKLGLNNNIGALDLPSGCSGFTNAIGVIKALIESGQCNNVLLLIGDSPGLVCHPDDFSVRSLFSDAGSCVFFTKTEDTGIGKVVYGADGKGSKALLVDRSGFRNPVDEKWMLENSEKEGLPMGQLKMDGLEVFSFSLKRVPSLVDEILLKNGLSFADIDLFIFHQASIVILKFLQKKMNIPNDKMVYCIEKFGNTVANTIPITLKELEQEGRIKEGSKVLVAGFGIGFSWSGTVLFY